MFQGAVVSHRQRVAPRFLQLSERKELNRQHNQPRNLGHIESRLELAAAAVFCQLRFPAERPDSQQLQLRVNRVRFYAEMVGENKG